MDFSQMFVSRPEFKDFQRGVANQHSHAEIVLIDRSPTGAVHQAYQLKSEYHATFDNLDQIRREFLGLEHDAFIVLGEVLEIDSVKKIIKLTNRNLITYRYLILFNGNEQPIELSTALFTLKSALLLDAINIKDKIPLAPSPYIPLGIAVPQKPILASLLSNAPQSIGKVARPCMDTNHLEDFAIDLGATSRSLCQVQL